MLIQQNSLTILINKVLGQSAKLRLGGNQLLYHCPFCNESKKVPKLEVCLDQNGFGQFHCWLCNVKGGSIANLFRKLKVKKSYFVELFNITKDVSVLQKRKYTKQENNIVLPDEFKPLSVPSKDLDYRHSLLYLKKRGLTRDDILRYNIGYCNSGEYKNRIVIPSYDSKGDLNFFVTRTYFDNGGMTYKNCPYSKDIIGFELFVNWDEPITLVEGPFDAFSVRKNVIPLFGKIVSSTLKQSLIEYGVEKVNVCLDDDALKDSLYISENLISQGIEVNLIRLDGKDPSKIGFDNVSKTINSSKPLEFKDIILLKMNN